MSWFQKQFTLPSHSRGSYLITDEVLSALPEIKDYKIGILHLFIQHTSCALALNENWDDDVRADMSDALDRIAPFDRKGTLYRHSAEGEDDMPVGSTGLLHISIYIHNHIADNPKSPAKGTRRHILNPLL
jgi:secondary thiamine-phosphate synthase enzyme